MDVCFGSIEREFPMAHYEMFLAHLFFIKTMNADTTAILFYRLWNWGLERLTMYLAQGYIHSKQQTSEMSLAIWLYRLLKELLYYIIGR